MTKVIIALGLGVVVLALAGMMVISSSDRTSAQDGEGAAEAQTAFFCLFFCHDRDGASQGQMIGGGGKSKNVNAFFPLFWNRDSTNESENTGTMAMTGTVSDLQIHLEHTVGTNNFVVYTIRMNGSNTAIACTISGGSETTCDDKGNEACYEKGDTIALRADGSGSQSDFGDPHTTWTAVFTPGDCI